MAEDSNPTTQDPDRKAVEDARMTFVEHLYDLRKRLRNAALIFIVVTIGSFFFAEKYFELLTRPARVAWTAALKREPVFVFTNPTEAFWVYTKLAMYAALIVSCPFIIWEIWKFIAPGLYRKEKRMALTVTIATAMCFVGGAIFGYVLISKPALTFLFGLSEAFTGPLPFKIEPMVKMEEMVGFMLAMLLGTGVAFELPVVLAVLGWLGLVTSRGLWKFNKYALILSTVVGGVLTPGPDVLSQLLMAGPLFGLFQVSIVVVWLIERGRRKKMEALSKETGADLMPSG
ncbi:MAG TPA: twin-arginine translocase subunit TatC [Vicinamibacterales bacterium]|nr:twin-arginine translocase subunit TatC [Vicinamibacterales bacterium]